MRVRASAHTQKWGALTACALRRITPLLLLCCSASSVLAAAVNVKSCGALGNGITDDGPAIQRAINMAAQSRPSIVIFPNGRYRVTQAIRPEYDGMTLEGQEGAVLIADPRESKGVPPPSFPEAILVNRGYPGPPQPVSNLTIQNLTVEVRNGNSDPQISTASIQLNNCINCLVERVHVVYTGALPKPNELDGIGTSQGTSGLIKDCIVDGIPKAGIYASAGTHDLTIEDCEVMDAKGPLLNAQPGFGRTGFSLTGSHIQLLHCRSHDNELRGVLITTNGYPTQGIVYPAPVDIQLSDCDIYDNGGNGIELVSQFDGAVPSNIQLDNLTLNNNDGVGYYIQAAENLTIQGGEVRGSGSAGIWIENIPISPGYAVRTQNIAIQNVQIGDNGRLVGVDVPGIGLVAANDVTISGGKIYRSDPTRNQIYGVGLYRDTTFFASPSEIQITGVDFLTGLTQSVTTVALDGIDDPLAAAVSGYYDIAFYGDPEGILSAPFKSLYTNVKTGNGFLKATGIDPTGWISTGP
ncbi:MAG TPA: right-handed parallel beta-helix repeat-containing protein [Chthonomonadaceae bacterium]|nr:right-handed parallel beta-helix repeat-containing protein [Chthonomonadaceae bacterium]